VLLPNNDLVNRAINSFDRNSTVDGHKIGVIYIGDGQTKEAEILANTEGSPAYTEFMSQLGALVRLKDVNMNSQGLDRTTDGDGAYTYCWRDRCTEVVFHVSTMMPTDLENDPLCTRKKSHIGNDFVNIIWNDSGTDFKFDTFPSDFNYVYIVITPEVRTDFIVQRKHIKPEIPPTDTNPSSPDTVMLDSLINSSPAPNTSNTYPSTLFYTIQVLSAPSFPSISPAAEAKLISAKALPPFVRLLALNASFFSLVWSTRDGGPGNEYISPWRNRLREIKKLRDKYGAVVPPSPVVSISGLGTGGLDGGSATSSMPPTPGGPNTGPSSRNSTTSATLSALSLLQPPGSSAGRVTQRASMQFGSGTALDGSSGSGGMF
jgi:hypothetical protein